MSKFKVGDKVVRTGRTIEEEGMHHGNVYTVERCVTNTVYLEECPYRYDAGYFELVEQKEKEMTFKNMKFDVAAIAKQLNVEHEEASRIIQEALFEQGCQWGYGGVAHTKEDWLFVRYGTKITWSDEEDSDLKSYTVKPTYAIVEAEEQQEIVELNGKKYNKQELEKALSLLKPIE